jgi:hypothetical protein
VEHSKDSKIRAQWKGSYPQKILQVEYMCDSGGRCNIRGRGAIFCDVL